MFFDIRGGRVSATSTRSFTGFLVDGVDGTLRHTAERYKMGLDGIKPVG